MKRKEKIIPEEIIEPFHNFHLKDILQIIIGATILAIPVGFTEESWKLGETLPLINVFGFMILSLVFTSLFVYYHYHHKNTQIVNHKTLFFKRVLSTYFLSFAVVSILLFLIEKAPWNQDLLLAFKRTVIVTLPSSMSATIADTLK